MRNDNHRFAFDERIEALLNIHFVFYIERGADFVKDDNRRIFQKGTRNGKTLALSAGKPAAVFADDCIVAFSFMLKPCDIKLFLLTIRI